MKLYAIFHNTDTQTEISLTGHHAFTFTTQKSILYVVCLGVRHDSNVIVVKILITTRGKSNKSTHKTIIPLIYLLYTEKNAIIY